jgi:HAD superfamily hydrolase (TIGR01549 family)
MKIKAITFDLWGTLIHESNTKRLVRKFVLKYLDEKTANTMFTTNYTKKQFFKLVENKAGKDKAKQLEKIMKTQIKNYRTYKDIKYVLELSKKYKIGIISNASFVSNELLKQWPYKKYFKHIIFSYQYEIAKPNKKLFLIAARKMNINPENVLHIGNDYKEDYLIPKQHKLNTVYLDRNNWYPNLKYRIRSFKQLENYIKKIENKK